MQQFKLLPRQKNKICWENPFRIIIAMALMICMVFAITLFTADAKAVDTTTVQTGSWVTRMTGSPMGKRVAMAADNDGWMLHFAGSTAYLARYNGLNWSIFGTVGHSQDIVKADIKMVSANDGWLVLGGWLGETPAQSSVYRWNGTTWNFFTTITDPNAIQLSSLNVLSANNVWALGGGNFWSSLYHWDGNAWNLAGSTPGGVWADSDLDMLSPNNGWAVGLNGAITHWNGSVWSQVASGTNSNLNAIAMVNSSDGWAVGDNGTILRWDGNSWSTYSSTISANLLEIDMVSANEGWIIGQNTILFWDGNSWSSYTPPLADQFNDIHMLSATDGWIVGNGSLLQYQTNDPKLTVLSYSSGAPGSYFNVLGQNFPADSMAEIRVNGQVLGTTQVTSIGRLYFTLTTDEADDGLYFVTASVNPSATTRLVLDSSHPVRPEDNPGTLYGVPAGIAVNNFIYLPVVIR
jgi:hypothetical protein